MPIQNFQHNGLKKFFESGSKSSIQPSHAKKLELLLDRLDAAITPLDMNFPGSQFHLLKGNLKGFCAVHVNANWVLIFRFEDGNAYDVDYLDYH